MHFFSVFLLLFSVHSLQAYIPRTKTIIKKMVRNNGRGEYKILREVLLESKKREIRIQEKWFVANGNKMKLEAKSLDPNDPWNFVIVYADKNRKTLSSRQKTKSFKKSREFFEPLFHYRKYQNMMEHLISHGFVPDWIQKVPPPRFSDGKTLITPEPFLSLEPLEGSVNYAIGPKQTVVGGKKPARLWVEQDSFVIRKARLSSKAEFINGPFQSFTGRLKLPSKQSIYWNNGVAHIQLLKVEKIRTKKRDWALKKTDQGNIPVDSLIKEFYTRFR